MTPPPVRRPVLLASLLAAASLLVYVGVVVPSGAIEEATWLGDGYVVCMAGGIGLVVTAPVGRVAQAWLAWWIGTCSVATLLLLPLGAGFEAALVGFVLGTFVWGAITGPAGVVYGIARAALPRRPR
jgi:hypothetical protein